MKGNSLGFGGEVVTTSRIPKTTNDCVDIESVQVSSTRRWQMNRTVCLCCTFTTILVASAIGVGIWFVVTEN